MAIQLDHFIVPCPDRAACARQLGELLGVAWAESSSVGPFSPVYVNDGLTLDFDQTDAPYPIGHFAFRVDAATFDAVLARIRAAGIDYRSTPHGSVDHAVNTAMGGRMVYWNEPAGHYWELLTVSYARPPQSDEA